MQTFFLLVATYTHMGRIVSEMLHGTQYSALFFHDAASETLGRSD